MIKYIAIIMLTLSVIHSYSQKTITVMFYNTENTLDTINDPKTLDDEYTKKGKKKWDTKRYVKKLDNIAKVISSISPPTFPEIVGLAEVETSGVLKDLCSRPLLKQAEYNFVHVDGPDERGIDVALLYKPDVFKYLSHKVYEISSEQYHVIKVRDILYVSGICNKDTLHIFVNHWKSRSDGRKATEPARIYSASVLDDAIDELIKKNKNAKIIVMGDFNDEPTDKSIFKTLDATNRRKNETNSELYNPFYDVNNLTDEGTIYYNGKWQLFDQIMVSQGLVKTSKGLYSGYEKPFIFKPDWLLAKDQQTGINVPKRTFSGEKYIGGYSDHLPVYIILKTK